MSTKCQPCRLVTTYSRPASEFLDNRDIDRSKLGPGPIQDFAGGLQQACQALVNLRLLDLTQGFPIRIPLRQVSTGIDLELDAANNAAVVADTVEPTR